MITDLNELFQDIESRIGRKLTQDERLAIKGEVAVNAISKESRMDEVARSIADRIIGLE